MRSLIHLSLALALGLLPSAPGTAQSAGSRSIQFVNHCPFTVWLGISGGAVPGPIVCGSNSPPCPTGSTCSTLSSPNMCFWNNPAPANGDYALTANGGSTTLSIPSSANPNQIFNGVITGRTGCQSGGTGCATAGCSGAACPAGQGFNQPATQAEFTLQNNAADFYDISLINGFNVPIEMAAVPPSGGGFGPAPTGTNAASYWCGNPGGASPSTAGLKGCDWTFFPPAIQYQWVAMPATGAQACTANTDCQSPQVCGLANGLVSTCGNFQGYWSADQACGVNASFGAPFDCAKVVPPGNGAYGTLTGLYQCEPANSCYTSGAGSTCCGCQNWPGFPALQTCNSTNPFWTANVLPNIGFLKNACPTAYSYPFDDMSSSFTCQTTGTTNEVDYSITYCPGGQTGVPATAARAARRKG